MLINVVKNNKNNLFKIKKLYQCNQCGYLMVEVLISLVIFSFSLVSLLALQLNSYSSTQSASYRSIATNYANDMLDKMRSNRDAVLNGSYTTLSAANNSCRNVNYNSVNTVTDCTSAQMAQDDLKELSSQVAGSLPQGAVVVCLDSSQSQGTPSTPNCNNSGKMYVIKIFWKDTRSKLINTNSGYAQVIIGSQL